MDYPNVTVEELTNQNATELVKKYAPRGVNLDDAVREQKVAYLISQLREHSGRRFLLRWTGGKVPKGANILGHQVIWTQNGMVQAKPVGNIGTYDRLVEFGGESGEEQMMIVYLYPSL